LIKFAENKFEEYRCLSYVIIIYMKPSFSPTLKESFRLIKRNAVEITGIALFFTLCPLIISHIPTPKIIIIILIIFFGFVIFLLQSLLIIIVVGRETGYSVPFLKNIQYMLTRLIPVFLTFCLSQIIISIGSLLLVIPGIIFMIGYSQAFNFALIGGDSPISALKKSWQITKGKRFLLFGLYFLFVIIIDAPFLLINILLIFIKFPYYLLYFLGSIMSSIFFIINYVLWKTLNQNQTV
jgi:hypothetical protein